MQSFRFWGMSSDALSERNILIIQPLMNTNRHEYKTLLNYKNIRKYYH